MDATINALGDLLLKAIPTVILFLCLTAYLKRVYFQPLGRTLEERHRATEGLRELSEKAFAAADEKNSAYERALQIARNEIGAENDKLRQRWSQEQAGTVASARAAAEAKLTAEREVIAGEVAQASSQIQAQIQPLAEQIIAALVRRRAA